MIRLAITGAGGFVGGAIAAHFRNAPGYVALPLGRPSEPRLVDLTDLAAITSWLGEAKPDVVVHAAGRIVGSQYQLFRDNALATHRLLEATASVVPGAHVILLGSAAEYGDEGGGGRFREDDPCDPSGPYGTSKLAATEHARQRFGQQAVTVLRVFNIVSADPSSKQVLAAFIARAKEALSHGSSLVEMDSLEAVRDFVTVPELLATIERAVTRRVTGEVINVCSGEAVKVRDLLERAKAMLGLPVTIAGRHSEPGSWSVGDPTKCRALLGIAPSGSLTEALGFVGAHDGRTDMIGAVG